MPYQLIHCYSFYVNCCQKPYCIHGLLHSHLNLLIHVLLHSNLWLDHPVKPCPDSWCNLKSDSFQLNIYSILTTSSPYGNLYLVFTGGFQGRCARGRLEWWWWGFLPPPLLNHELEYACQHHTQEKCSTLQVLFKKMFIPACFPYTLFALWHAQPALKPNLFSWQALKELDELGDVLLLKNSKRQKTTIVFQPNCYYFNNMQQSPASIACTSVSVSPSDLQCQYAVNCMQRVIIMVIRCIIHNTHTIIHSKSNCNCVMGSRQFMHCFALRIPRAVPPSFYLQPWCRIRYTLP